MKIDKGISIPPKARFWNGNRKYRFDGIAHGDSIHVADEKAMRSVKQSFRSYTQVRGLRHLSATSRAVDASDPSGEGYRIWFVSSAPNPNNDI